MKRLSAGKASRTSTALPNHVKGISFKVPTEAPKVWVNSGYRIQVVWRDDDDSIAFSVPFAKGHGDQKSDDRV